MATKPPERVEVLGVPVDALSAEQTVDRIVGLVASGGPSSGVGINAANLITARDHPGYRRHLERADIVSADGQSIVWTARLLGAPVTERVAGIDLMQRLVREAHRRQWRIYLLGGTRPVVAELARRLRNRECHVVGYRDGYFSPNEHETIVSELTRVHPDVLFVGMPSPAKEAFVLGPARVAGVPFSLGVGGSFDVLAGRRRRAPRWMQAAGLEWLFRLVQEPRRLWWRYLSTNARLVVLVTAAFARQRWDRVSGR